MPLYRLECANGHGFDRFLKLAEYDTPQTCECGAKAERRIMPTMVAVDNFEYRSPVDGRLIRGRRQRQEDLRRNNCVEYDPSMKTEYERRTAKQMQDIERQVDEHVDREIALMPARKRELLEQELRGGADVAVERTAVNI